MLARLEWMTLKPKVVLEVGMGLISMREQLQSRYSQAEIITLCAAEPLFSATKTTYPDATILFSDTVKIPLPDDSVDCIFANFFLPWQEDFRVALREWRRVLREDGVLIFNAFGPDTLGVWQSIFADTDIPVRVDMHDIGDELLQMGFADPVLDVDHCTLIYRDQAKLINELKESGMLAQDAIFNAHDVLANEEGAFEVVFEMVYAHAFAAAKHDEVSAVDGTVSIPLATLRKQLRGG